jgi:hypothetical protein
MDEGGCYKNKQNQKIMCWQGHGDTGTLVHCLWGGWGGGAYNMVRAPVGNSLAIPQRAKHKITM